MVGRILLLIGAMPGWHPAERRVVTACVQQGAAGEARSDPNFQVKVYGPPKQCK